MAGLFASAELHTVTGKLLAGPELINSGQAWIQLHCGHGAVTSIKTYTAGHILSPNENRISWLLGGKQLATHSLNTCMPIKTFKWKLLNLLKLLEQVLCTWTRERNKMQFPTLFRKLSNWNFLFLIILKNSLTQQELDIRSFILGKLLSAPPLSCKHALLAPKDT